MSYSYTSTGSETFTLVHAKKLASKVAADLKRMQRFYGWPSDTRIAEYETEVIELLKKGYLERVTYGYRRNGDWIAPTLRYTAKELSSTATAIDDDPGRVPLNADIKDASPYSYLTYTSAWHALSTSEQEAFEKNLPFKRSGAPEPGVNGYFSDDKTYSAGGVSVNRSSVKSY